MRKVTIRETVLIGKKDTLVGSPSKRSFFLGRRKPRWQKRKKTIGGFKIAKKIVLSPVLEKDFVSCDTLFFLSLSIPLYS